MKPYLVLQYLQANTDEAHSVSASEISGYLEEILGINADRRSIYSDIDEINAVAWMLENDTGIDEAYEAIKEEDAEKLIVYDRKKGGYNITHRKFEVHDLRVIAECIYSAKFLTERKAKSLIDVVCGFVSENEAEQIRHTLGVLRCFKDVENIFKAVHFLFRHLQFTHRICPHPFQFSVSQG